MRILIQLILFFLPFVSVSAQYYSIYFDKPTEYEVVRGKAEIIAGKGKKGSPALRLSSNTKVLIPVKIEPNSQYRIAIWLRTTSGSENISLSIGDLGKWGISLSSALPNWSKAQDQFCVGNKSTITLEVEYPASATDAYGWIDDIKIQRLGEYEEKKNIHGIPPIGKRKIRTEFGLEMQPDEKMQWMLDAKLGMFIHWGPYAGPARGEWYMERSGVRPEKYRKICFPGTSDVSFDASKFNPDEWIDLAKKAGMRYATMTTMHHDGYALFESHHYNAFTSMQTHGRDFVKEFVMACRRGGLKVGLYKTLINWRYPGYFDVNGGDMTPNSFKWQGDKQNKENARIMKDELYYQVKELMTNYGKIDQLYWDGAWVSMRGHDPDGVPFWESGKYLSDDNQWPIDPENIVRENGTGKPLGLMGMVRQLQPDLVVNPRSGWHGDYLSEEGGGPVKGPVRTDVVEKNFAIHSNWGYSESAEDTARIMPLQKIKRICADCMVRNMCFLMNVGPDRFGVIPKGLRQRFLEFGSWVNTISEAIYGTRGGPWDPEDGQYGFTYNDNKIYIYFLGGYTDSQFDLPELNKGMKVVSVRYLASKKPVQYNQKGVKVKLQGLQLPKDDITVLELQLNKSVY